MKGRKHRATGGADEAEADLKDKPENRSYTGEKEEGVPNEAEEMKKGGRAKKARGGKMMGKVEGEKNPLNAGRKPRKSGGRASSGSDSQPFTSARRGNDAPGRKLMKGEAGYGED
jgi:hypothetical protein